MRSLNYVRWVYALLAIFIGGLFLYVAIETFTAAEQTNERIVAAVIGGVFCLAGCALAPVWKRD